MRNPITKVRMLHFLNEEKDSDEYDEAAIEGPIDEWDDNIKELNPLFTSREYLSNLPHVDQLVRHIEMDHVTKKCLIGDCVFGRSFL